ncbi:MAG: NAD(P)H-binding protein [Gaiellaceae bacterium]
MILVTGATGFVGGHVARLLRDRQRSVRCLVRSPRRADGLRDIGCELAQGDVTDPASLARACSGVDAVLHLVAIIRGRRADYERVMIDGTRALVEASAEAGVRRFVLASALGVSEETRELTPYFHAKWEMERTLKASGREHVILRPSFVFARDGGVLPTFLRLVRLLPVTPVLGPGSQRIQPIWADDLAAYFDAAIDSREAADRTFELGGADRVTWDVLYGLIARVLGKRRPRLHIPFAIAHAQAALLQWAPGFPYTRDQLRMLAAGDNVAEMGPAYDAFGLLQLVPLEEQIRRAI